MKEIEIIIYIISLIFLLEKKGINSIINFIILIILLSLYIYLDINYSYLSFILIIIYSTAIIILFSFIIMLPEGSESSESKEYNKYIPYIILPLSIIFYNIFTLENIYISTSNVYLFVPLIGDYLYNSIEGFIFIFIILLLLLLPIPGIFFLLK